MNADGGDLDEDIGEDCVDVDQLEDDIDVVFLRKGGGERGWMWTMLSRLPALFELFEPVDTLGRRQGGGEGPLTG